MNKEQLLDAVGQVEDAIVEEAAQPPKTVKFTQSFWFKPLAAAACCVLVVGGLLNSGLFRMGSTQYSAGSASSSAMAYDSVAEMEEAGWAGGYDSGYGMKNESTAEAPAPDQWNGDIKGGASANEANIRAAISRKIIYTAGMTMESTQFEETLKQVLATVEEMGGYVESCDQGGKADYNSRWYSASLRIPTENYNQFISGAQELANVIYLSQSTRDITLDYVDTEARIDSLETQRDRLNELAAKAETVEDLIYIQGQLSDVEYQLESYASRLRLMDDQVYLSTVNLDLNEVRVETPVENSFARRFGFAVANGWNNFVDALEDFVIGIGLSWPWFLLLGVAVGVVAVILKKRKK